MIVWSMSLLFPVGAPTTESVIGAAIRVHKALGPGLLESAYQACLAHELSLSGHQVDREVEIPIVYRGISITPGYRADLVVGGSVLVEVKAVERIHPIHEAQVLTYLRAGRLRTGLLLNFNVQVLKDGLRRILL